MNPFRLSLLLLFPLVLQAAEESVSSTTESISTTPWSIRATDHFIFSNAPENAEDKTLPSTKLFLNELKVSTEYGSFNGHIQISNRLTPDGNQSRNAPVKLEKKLLAYEGETWNLKVGDTHQEYGRGIALSLYNDGAFGIDNTLEGVSTRVDASAVKAGLMAGRVNTLRSPIAINVQNDPLLTRDVYLAGTDASVQYAQGGRVGAHGLVTLDQDYATQIISRRQYTLGASVSQENILEGVDFYLESNYLNTVQRTPNEVEQPGGYGSFASVTYTELPWRVKVEGKDFRKFHYDWQRPPTLEEDIIRENNFKDVTAVRVGVERRFLEGNAGTVFVNHLVGDDRHVSSVLNHSVVGSKFPVGKPVEVELRGGYRWIANRQNLLHTSVKTKVRTGKGEALEFEYRRQFWNLALETSNPTTEERNLLTLGYIFNEKLSALIGYEYIPTQDLEQGQNFVNVGATYKEGWLSTRAFVGQTSGGTQCNGGICRQVAPYTGAYLEGTVSF